MFHARKGSAGRRHKIWPFLLCYVRCALIGVHGVTGWRGVGGVGMEGVGVSAGVGTWK